MQFESPLNQTSGGGTLHNADGIEIEALDLLGFLSSSFLFRYPWCFIADDASALCVCVCCAVIGGMVNSVALLFELSVNSYHKQHGQTNYQF